MKVVSLFRLIQSSEESEVKDYLSSFSCRANPRVEGFLKSTAIESEKRSMARTSLVIDEQHNDIVGYFTLMNKQFELIEEVSGTIRQKIAFNKRATSISTILIAQLGRSDAYKGIIGGSEILRLALENCRIIHRIIGLRIVCVEYEPINLLTHFYEENAFKFLQDNPNGYRLSFLRLS